MNKSAGMITGFLLIVSLLTTSAPGCTGRTGKQAQTLYNIPYGSDPLNVFDLSLPEGRTMDTPVIILLHGGAWISGDKKDFDFLREYFCTRGFAVFSVNYRLARLTGKGIDNILEDISGVVELARGKSGIWIYSKERLFIAGHSAGGHMALLYAFTHDSGRFIRGAVSFCGVTDLTDPELKRSFDRLQLDEVKSGKMPFDLVDFMTGGSSELKRRYSPLYMTSRVPVLLFTGQLDTVIPWQQSALLHRKMKSEGFDSTLHVYPDMGHDITVNYKEIMLLTEKWIKARSGDKDSPVSPLSRE